MEFRIRAKMWMPDCDVDSFCVLVMGCNGWISVTQNNKKWLASLGYWSIPWRPRTANRSVNAIKSETTHRCGMKCNFMSPLIRQLFLMVDMVAVGNWPEMERAEDITTSLHLSSPAKNKCDKGPLSEFKPRTSHGPPTHMQKYRCSQVFPVRGRRAICKSS